VPERRRRASWGSVRLLSSGRWQARYQIDGIRHRAPTTFRTRYGAEAFLAATRADLERGSWASPRRGRILLRDYARTWLDQKVNLRPRSREQYGINLRRHVLPLLGDLELVNLTTARVREWRANLLRTGSPGPSTVAKAYRLLHAVMATAVEDELIARSPCVVRGATAERPVGRPIASIRDVLALAKAIEPRLSLLVLLAGFTGLRLGELRALRRDRIDVARGTLRVVDQLQELASGQSFVGPPKSDAGRRTIALPAALLPALEEHLAAYCKEEPGSYVFASASGTPLARKTIYRHWSRAVQQVGLVGFRFHDLRHTANTLSASTGASTRELMARMGHSSPRAALIYQHATSERDAAIAEAVSRLIDPAASHL
jgi:integrase